jgi:hypothetical protein
MPTLYEYDQSSQLQEWAEGVVRNLYDQFVMSDGLGLICVGDTYRLPTSRDNWKDTGYLAFHEGYIAVPLYITAGIADTCNTWPAPVRKQIEHVLELNKFEAIRGTLRKHGEEDEISDEECLAYLEELKARAEKWERDRENTLDQPEPYYEAHQWLEDYYAEEGEVACEDDCLFQLKLNAYLKEWDDGTGGDLTVRLSVNTDSPYFREHIPWLKHLGGEPQQEFDLWTTTIPFTGCEITGELLSHWADEIYKSMRE